MREQFYRAPFNYSIKKLNICRIKKTKYLQNSGFNCIKKLSRKPKKLEGKKLVGKKILI